MEYFLDLYFGVVWEGLESPFLYQIKGELKGLIKGVIWGQIKGAKGE